MNDAGERDSNPILQTLKPGTVVDGKYRVDELVGRGGMGVVLSARHVGLGERVALKFLHVARSSTGDDFTTRFRREARLSARLKSEHFARVIDVGVWRDSPYMVMEYVVGGDLRAFLRWSGPLPLRMVVDFAVQLCTGLAVVHALGAVHRDLKSQNVFVTARPDGTPLLKILDFGISKWSNEEEDIDLTHTGTILGSPRYMAPEQLFGAPRVDARADVWSAGVIVYEMLTARLPFDYSTVGAMYHALATDEAPPPMSTVRGDVPEELEKVVLRCFAREPVNRIPNVAVLAASLLGAVRSPDAASVEASILATLDRTSGRDIGSDSGSLPGSVRSGSFTPVSWPTPPPRGNDTAVTVSLPSEVAAAGEPDATTTLPDVTPPVQRSPRATLWLSLAAVGVMAGLGAFLGVLRLAHAPLSPTPGPVVTGTEVSAPPSPAAPPGSASASASAAPPDVGVVGSASITERAAATPIASSSTHRQDAPTRAKPRVAGKAQAVQSASEAPSAAPSATKADTLGERL